MATLELPPPQARRILELARTDRDAARAAMAEHSVAAQVALVCETPVQRRADLIDLAEEPNKLIPALPPAELCFTVLAVGLDDAAWLLEHATRDQICTAIDLDAWAGTVPDRKRIGDWLTAFADAGEDTLMDAAKAVDLEAWVLHLMGRVAIELKPSGDDDWEPPAGGLTHDGQFYVIARDPDDDLAELMDLLRVLFQRDYWFYFRLLQGVIWELPSDSEEWALRWRTGRLEDLGFPPPLEAKAIYARLDDVQRRRLSPEERAWKLDEWPLPVWMPNLPAVAAAEHSLFQAFAELPEADRRPFLLEFLSLANRVAVADDLPLGEATTLPAALIKATRFTSLGLDLLAAEHGLRGSEVLLRARQDRLFQIGFNLEWEAGRAEPPLRVDPDDEATADAEPPPEPDGE